MARPSHVEAEQARPASGSWDSDVLELEDEGDEDITRARVLEGGDPQGIQWDRLNNTREMQRDIRRRDYPNYFNCEPEVTLGRERLIAEAQYVNKNHEYYSFEANMRQVRFTIVHFQLRNLLWATSNHDVYVMDDYAIVHWDLNSRKNTKVLDLARGVRSPSPCDRPGARRLVTDLDRVQISTCCVGHGLVAAGGFHGELVVRSLSQEGILYGQKVTDAENGITNGIEIFQARSGATSLMTSNNDKMVRILDTANFASVRMLGFDWPVNFSTLSPDGSLCAVVGDDPVGLLVDMRTDKHVAQLEGHFDYSFAAAWHPAGHLLATGNQDQSVRLWDVRKPSESLKVLRGELGAIRSLRFSSDGRFLASAEPADIVTLYDVASNFEKGQEVDLFGEIAGMAFSPDSDRMFVGIADISYPTFVVLNQRSHAKQLPHARQSETPADPEPSEEEEPESHEGRHPAYGGRWGHLLPGDEGDEWRHHALDDERRLAHAEATAAFLDEMADDADDEEERASLRDRLMALRRGELSEAEASSYLDDIDGIYQ